MVQVIGLNKIEQIADAQKKIKELNKNHFDRVVTQYVENGVEKELAKVLAKAMINCKLA